MTSYAHEITADTSIPQLLARYPHVRGVLDAHGLRGCGGEHGPVESLGFYARMHAVDLPGLLQQLRLAAVSPTDAPAAAAPSVADSIYRRYFLTAIAVILTAGASWGAAILWQIAMNGSFTGASIHHINAHGHAQIFGWVGLFIMGFGYQAFPRFWQTELAAPRLAVMAYVLMTAGTVLRIGTISLGTWESAGLWVDYAGLLGGAMQIVAASCFAGQLAVTFRNSMARLEPWTLFVFLALGWFLLQTAMSAWHGWNLGVASSREQVIHYVSTYQAALRDMQVYGLGMMMILGVSQRLLPPLLGVPATPALRAWAAAAILTLAILGQVAMYITFRLTGQLAFAGGLVAGWALMACGVALVALPWRLWRRPPNQDQERVIKFIRVAYLWLLVALTMLLLLPVYQQASGLMYSHAYYGAIRHAVTVGFISMMIVGVAAKVVPTLNGVDPRRLPALWGPFILLNTGCFLRVTLQVATDWHPLAFRLAGFSALLEVAALTWWAIHLAGIMRSGRQQQADSTDDASHASPPPREITAEHRVADILRWHPQTQGVFDEYGFTMLRNPVLRRTMARHVTLAQAAAHRGVDAGELLQAIQSVTTSPAVASHDCSCSGHHRQA